MVTRTSNKYILGLVLLLIILGGAFYVYNKKEAKAPTPEVQNSQQQNGYQQPAATTTNQNSAPAPQTQTNVKGNTGPDYTPGKYSGGGETGGSDIAVEEVDYDGKVFTPSTITIHVNDYIFFRNKSTAGFWPKTADGSYTAFDAGKTIAPGAQFKFQFTKAGTFKYEDKLNPGATGTVTVTQ